MRVRRRAHLVCRWEADGLFVALPDQRRWLCANSDLMSLLHAATEWTDADDLAARFGAEHAGRAHAAIKALHDAGLLVSDDTDDALPPVWAHWGVVAQRAHVDARDANYLVDSPRRAEVAGQITADGQPPAPFKTYPDAPALFLPRRAVPLRTPVEEVFAARRTHRRFADAPVDVDALATVLSYTFAPQRFLDGGPFGVQQARVAASAGGRHEVECYVVVFAVDGVPPGLYHYAPDRHCLELLDPGVDRATVAALGYGQEPSYRGAFTCLTTAVAGRLSWKYRHPRAYRLWMYDAGHYGQTFALTCVALGLAPFQTVAFHDSRVEALLGLDPDEEFAVYLLAAGLPEPAGVPGSAAGAPGPGPTGLPVDHPHPPLTRLATARHTHRPAEPAERRS
ncbi:SagB/ThcOx family dehydrogenase [Micromonospora sp. WMMD882]|uniref:SagB/ThcOx family dehydrogenase n=1 Tax=Micromonospora sp. WMMD882 TaxID=3015151 RepID=UPI00248B62AC|nr:SagB/ThcOx family dehydrogenase [Micromonospora sp. WMMD882]WBB78168.1 SagB/ThcOx family dehydrogenase [Micromonospora sp. WMMD882]